MGAAVKRLADGFILAGKAIQNAADLVHFISESNSTVSVFHIEKLDVNLPENVPVFPGTMKIHQILIRDCAVKYREFSCYCRENDFCECYEWKCVHYSGPHEEAATAPEDSGGDELFETHGDGAVAAQSQVFSELDTLVNCDPVASFVPVESPSVAAASSAETPITSQSESAGLSTSLEDITDTVAPTESHNFVVLAAVEEFADPGALAKLDSGAEIFGSQGDLSILDQSLLQYMDASLERSGVNCSALDDADWAQLGSVSIGLTTPGTITDELAVYKSRNAVSSCEDTGGNGSNELPETHGDGAVAAQSQVFSELDTLVNCDPVASFVPVESPSVAAASSITSQSESAGLSTSLEDITDKAAPTESHDYVHQAVTTNNNELNQITTIRFYGIFFIDCFAKCVSDYTFV